jgi:hypothetical protein
MSAKKILNSAAMDGRFLILAFRDERKSQRLGRQPAPVELLQ